MFPSPLNDHVNDLEHPAAGQHGLGGNKYPSGGGKTFTMVGTQDCPGIMVRALNHLFNQMDQDTDSVYKVRKAAKKLPFFNGLTTEAFSPPPPFGLVVIGPTSQYKN